MNHVKYFLLVMCLSFISSGKINSQLSNDWSRSYNPIGDNHQGANDVTTDKGGSVYVLGYTSRGYNGHDVTLVKYDPNGNYRWAKTIDGKNETNPDIGKSLAIYETSSEVFIYAGSDISISGYGNQPGIAKYDSSGVLQWSKNYPVGTSASVRVVKSDTSGNVYVAGGTGAEPFLIKMNRAGDTLWIRKVSVPSGYVNSIINDITIDVAGNIYGTGKSNNPSGNADDMITFKYNSSGVLQWSKFYSNGHRNDYGNAVKLSINGFLYVTGGSDPMNWQPDLVTIKYNTTTGDSVWVKRYSGVSNLSDIAYDIETDVNDNVFITGQIDGITNSGDIATFKYNSAGVFQWMKKFAGSNNVEDLGFELALDTSGNIYIAGKSNTGTGFGINYTAIKYNTAGDSLWTRLYKFSGNTLEAPRAMTFDKNNNMIISGDSYSIDMGTVKINSSGVLQWSRNFNGAQLISDYTNSIVSDKNGNVYMAGKSRSHRFGDQFTIVKYNSAGTKMWEKNYGFQLYDSYDAAKAMVIDNAGYLYIAGTSFARFSNLSNDYVTFKLDTSGNQIWYQTFNGAGNNDDDAKAIAVDIGGNVYITGESKSSGIDIDYCTVKYNSSGTKQWERYYNGPANGGDYAYDVATDNSGNVYVTGQSNGVGTSDDIATIKYNSAGTLLWVQRFNGTGNGADIGTTVETDHVGNAYVCGSTFSTGSGYNSILIKYGNTPSGNLRWTISESNHTGNIIETANAIKLDSSKTRIYMAGTIANSSDGRKYQVTAKYDSSGYRIKKQTSLLYSGSDIFSTDIFLDKDQNVYISGYRVYEDGSHPEVFLDVYDSSLSSFSYIHSGFTKSYVSPDAKDILKVTPQGRIFIGGGIYDSTAGIQMSIVQYKKQPYELSLNMLLQGFYDPASNTMTSDTVTMILKYSHNLLQLDSAIAVVNSSGTGLFKFTNRFINESNFFYIVIKHRNSIETWNSAAFKFINGSANLDLYSSAGSAYGNNLIQVDASPVRFAIYSGDVNQDGTIDITDGSLIDNDGFNFASGYINTDVNGDGVVDVSDAVFADNNGFNFVSKITP